MVMDQSLRDEYKLNDEISSILLDQNLINRFKTNNTLVNQNYVDIQLVPPAPILDNQNMSSVVRQEVDSLEDFDFSDVVLRYINEMLMEEDMEEKTCMFQESSAALQAAEKSLYELLGENYPPQPNYDPKASVDQNHEVPDENHDLSCSYDHSSTFSTNSDNLVEHGWNFDSGEYKSSNFASQSTSHESVMQFKRGFEEASKFLPNGNTLFVDLENNGVSVKELKEEPKNVVVKTGKRPVKEYSPDGSRGRKNRHPEDADLESGRSNKQLTVYTESAVSEEMFDMVLLNCGQSESVLREALQNGTSKNVQQNKQSKGSNGGRRGRKQGGKKDVVDLRTLLTLCAQAVAANDRRNACELLKQIRQHSSTTGDGMQRMAQCFADGLEARLAGAGTQIYTALITKHTSAADVLKAYHLFLAACPFRKLSNFFSNKTIMNLAEKATRLHIIDFGIMYGFQWPCLIQRLSSRPGGPPKLRITGIDLPQPGFRPAERVEETGRRLAKYAETFKVPFEFNAIAQKWDTIQIEDLKIESGEVLIVNCLFRFRYLLDETVVVDCPRNIVLNLIRKMNPDVFILGIVNGAHSAPFFTTRFREALFFYSTMFDMLDTNVPSEIPERMLIEREIFGREAMNVIACEGAERIERPETYKQWQFRNTRAGFTQLPLNEEMMKMAKERVHTSYHKDFVINEDSQWLLQGWKGRIVYALSSWKPSC
ncbi:Scarecrow-like protein [Melia azedarach]|uniref:Scarecrow-like protein n=1 Tax=Melia azedarach TaxID=155640 RepID=A0ACC1Y8K2_MELAZ|nr:Scarecrow-like protein [Melia azedarach]